MTLLSFVASQKDEQAILEQLILSEKAHINTNLNDLSEDKFITHEYEAQLQQCQLMTGNKIDDPKKIEAINLLSNTVQEIGAKLKIKLQINYNVINENYDFNAAQTEFKNFIASEQNHIEELQQTEKKHQYLKYLEHVVHSVHNRNIDFKRLTELNNFGFQVGLLSYEHTVQIRKNYENISAIVVRVGEMPDVKEDIYLIVYPNNLEQETKQLLKSVNWRKIRIPDEFLGDISQIEELLHKKIVSHEKNIEKLNGLIYKDIDKKEIILNRIYTKLELEKEVINLNKQLYHGNNIFVVRAWVPSVDIQSIEQLIANVTEQYVIVTKDAEEVDKNNNPPTLLKNNKLFSPFEIIVKMYGLPSYKEFDPTPFLAISMCLMFGIMFGDIGQGAIYFLAGLLVAKKNKAAGGLLKRLGSFSIAFGFFYGSLFGLEQHQLPWLPSILGGSPLDTVNILPILIASVVVGVILLTISYIMGIINSLKRGDIEHGIFGNHGVFGYIFYLSLVLLAVSFTGVIPIPPSFFATTLIISLIVIILKEPLAHFVEGKKPLIKGDKGSYFVENGFEGLETLLSALSNAISFIRVGAFALNHAGLFMAFLVMADLVSNPLLKVLILVLGNVLILTLEGLIVFIQCLRLEYYEMFNKYFSGEGYPYSPIILGNNKEII